MKEKTALWDDKNIEKMNGERGQKNKMQNEAKGCVHFFCRTLSAELDDEFDDVEDVRAFLLFSITVLAVLVECPSSKVTSVLILGKKHY